MLVIGPLWVLLLLAPVIGYGCAWTSHLLFEQNRRVTFSYPTWSLRSDLQLAWLAATGQLGRELQRPRSSERKILSAVEAYRVSDLSPMKRPRAIPRAIYSGSCEER